MAVIKQGLDGDKLKVLLKVSLVAITMTFNWQ